MCVLCPPISSAAFILARPWREEKSVQELFFDESLNRTKTGGGVKGEKIQCSATLVPPPQCSLKTLQYYITCMEDWQLLVYILVLKVVICCLLRYAIT